MKRMLAMLLAAVMLLAMGTTAFAAETATGSITISNAANVSVENKTFNAYKVLDLEYYNAEKSSYVYTVPEKLKSFYQTYFDIKDEGDFSAQVVNAIGGLKDQELFDFAQAALDAAKTAGITPGTATGGKDDTCVTINNLTLGYYVVEDAGSEKPISALILETTDPDVSVHIKADKPDIDKVIVEGEKTTDKNNASIGDKVSFKITSKVPDMTGYEKYYFIVTDTMSKGLSFNDDIIITVGGSKLEMDCENGYKVTTTTNKKGETVIEIVFKNFIKQKPDSAIVIEYSATVNEDAVIGTAGNPNSVNLEYSNNPNIKDNGQSADPDKPAGGDVTGKTPDEVTYTYLTGIEITKVNKDSNRLKGAEFEITGEKINNVLVKRDVYEESADGSYYKLKDGTYTEINPKQETEGKYESTTIRYKLTTDKEIKKSTESVHASGVVGDDGVLRFDGLAAGEYIIKELKAPDGYNLLKNPITVNIVWNAPQDGSTKCEWVATANETTNVVIEDGVIKLDIVNQAGSELPSTGGIGTTIFYAAGAVLMLFSVVLLVTKKRMSTKK